MRIKKGVSWFIVESNQNQQNLFSTMFKAETPSKQCVLAYLIHLYITPYIFPMSSKHIPIVNHSNYNII